MGEYWSVDEARWVRWPPEPRHELGRGDHEGRPEEVTVPEPRAEQTPTATAG